MKGVSGRAVHLSMHWEGKLLAVGSGFIVSLHGAHLLVTARHNLAGRHWETNEPLSRWSVTPDSLTIRMQANNPGVLEWANRNMPLVDKNDLPLWYEHPKYGRNADVAVLPLPDDTAYFVDAFDIAEPSPSEQPTLSAGDDLFVIGFPRGFSPHVGIPVWVRATVASEPAIGYKGLPVYLVDARTTAGQSGSAVVLRPGVNRAVRMVDGSIVGTSIDDSWIAGVYSGRVSLPQPALSEAIPAIESAASGGAPPVDQFDIGIVWTTGAILAAAEGRTRFPATGDGAARWEPDEDWSGSYDAEVAAD